MSICIILIQVVTNILIMPLIICLSEQEKEKAPCNTFILFFSHHYQLFGVYWSDNKVGRCSHVGGIW
jgi:hypothetical protein